MNINIRLPDLIDDYQSIKQQILNSIDSESEGDIKELDNEISEQFHSILTADVVKSDERAAQVRFLIDYLCDNPEESPTTTAIKDKIVSLVSG